MTGTASSQPFEFSIPRVSLGDSTISSDVVESILSLARTTSGLSSIDGYCKLEFWGIELYAAIDAYSRYIVWVYIGVTNRTGISVLRQYLDHVECEEVAPVVLRSDKGSETTMVAAAHHKIRQGQDPDIAFADCYRFGTSLSNQRIEAWWGQLTKSCLYRWRVCHFYYILLL
jgi:hypothetical protein